MNREQRSEFIRQSIITVAGDLFNTNGFDKTKVDDISDKAGLSKATFYAYFKSKQELLDTMLLLMLKDINRHIEQAIKKSMDEDKCDKECFISICRLFEDARKNNPVCFARMLANFNIVYDDKTPALYNQIVSEAKKLNDILYDAMLSHGLTGLFEDRDPDRAVFFLWVSIIGIINLSQKKESLLATLYGTSREDFLDFAFNQMFKITENA